jgi:hemerythrin-like domain-containing protein
MSHETKRNVEMKAIETLMHEHRTIEKTIDAMVAWAGTIGNEPDPADGEELGQFVTFLRDFVDGCHHAKEQEILFAMMVQHGFPRDQGPIAVMLHEHDLGRSHVATLASLAVRAVPWNDKERQQVEQTVRAYADLLRAHIQKEDGVLYPLAEARLPNAVKDEISVRCERFDAEQTGTGAHGRLHALAERLIEAHCAQPSPLTA